MSETSKKKRIKSQKIVGMQVIDAKGTVVGNVKDVGIDLADKQLIVYVTTKEKTEIEIPGNTIQSIEDVILLSGQEEMAAAPKPAPAAVAPLTTVTCPSCKTALPARAKFCAKCGSKVK